MQINTTNEVKEFHNHNSNFITDVVIGMSDGLTVPFALAAGVSGVVASNAIVTTAGIAEIIAGSIAMGLGGYLAGSTVIHQYQAELKREYDEVELYPEKEKQEVRDIFKDYGFSETSQHLLVEELAKDKHKWVDFMMKFELGLEKPNANQARNSALTIGGSYIVGGIIPLLPYFFTKTPTQGLVYSAIFTLLSLFVFGYFKSKVTDQPPIIGALKVTIIGVLAAGAAYGIARAIG